MQPVPLEHSQRLLVRPCPNVPPNFSALEPAESHLLVTVSALQGHNDLLLIEFHVLFEHQEALIDGGMFVTVWADSPLEGGL